MYNIVKNNIYQNLIPINEYKKNKNFKTMFNEYFPNSLKNFLIYTEPIIINNKKYINILAVLKKNIKLNIVPYFEYLLSKTKMENGTHYFLVDNILICIHLINKKIVYLLDKTILKYNNQELDDFIIYTRKNIMDLLKIKTDIFIYSDINLKDKDYLTKKIEININEMNNFKYKIVFKKYEKKKVYEFTIFIIILLPLILTIYNYILTNKIYDINNSLKQHNILISKFEKLNNIEKNDLTYYVNNNLLIIDKILTFTNYCKSNNIELLYIKKSNFSSDRSYSSLRKENKKKILYYFKCVHKDKQHIIKLLNFLKLEKNKVEYTITTKKNYLIVEGKFY